MNLHDIWKNKSPLVKDYLQGTFLRIKNSLEIYFTEFRLICTNKEFYVKYRPYCFKYGFPLLFVGLALYSCSTSQKQITRDIDDIFSLSDDVRAHFVTKPDYWKLSDAYIVENRIISKKFISNNHIALSSGKRVLIGRGINGDIVLPGSKSFDIVLTDLNRAQCIDYTEKPLSEEMLIKLVEIKIITSDKSYTFEWGGINPLPIQKYATKDFCSKTGNSIIWSLK